MGLYQLTGEEDDGILTRPGGSFGPSLLHNAEDGNDDDDKDVDGQTRRHCNDHQFTANRVRTQEALNIVGTQ